MAPEFRYRYVDFGTSFTGMPGERSGRQGGESPDVLFSNELALDVGATCWGANEPLPIIDHHFAREAQFPSTAAAVLHKANQIRGRYAGHDGVVWLVTHKEPDFDAFCSMYLARWIIEDPSAPHEWHPYGLHPDGWLDLPNRSKLDWFRPELGAIPEPHRWAVLLGSYASLLESRHRISCPRERALRSVLYAALKRGRDYLSETSGATELFQEVRSALVERQLNPVFDSVLENSSLFKPELAMLEREAAAYDRDLQRARRSTVYLPESEAPSPNFFKNPKDGPLRDQHRPPEIDAEHLLLADTFRTATDGIYLRDPECALFKEWARFDVENSFLGSGFEFTAIARSNGRPDARANRTDYEFSIDAERANGRHLFTVWSRLQTQEVEALRAQNEEAIAVPAPDRGWPSPNTSTPTLNSLLADPWLGGQSRFSNAVRTPHRGTLLGPAGMRGDLRDDPVAEAVRTELENSIYSALSLVIGPQVTIYDFAASRQTVDVPPHKFDLNSPLEIPAPPETYFRLAQLRLRSDVPISERNLSLQIGETLWQVLYPDKPGSTPAGFAERHLVVNGNSVGVWGDRGIAIAQKYDSSPLSTAPERYATGMQQEFAAMVSLARDVDRLTADHGQVQQRGSAGNEGALRENDVPALQNFVQRSQQLESRAVQVRHTLLLADRELLRRLYEAAGIDNLLAALHDLTITASGLLDRHASAMQARQTKAQGDAMAAVRKKLEWLEVFVIGFLVLVITHVLARNWKLNDMLQAGLILLGAPVAIAISALSLKPWKPKTVISSRTRTGTWILIAVIAACVVAWTAGALDIFSK